MSVFCRQVLPKRSLLTSIRSSNPGDLILKRLLRDVLPRLCLYRMLRASPGLKARRGPNKVHVTYDPPIEVALVERPTSVQPQQPSTLTKAEEDEEKRMAQEAKNQMERDIKDLSSPAAAALVRPGRKHYKGHKTAHKRIPIKQLLKNLREKQEKCESEGINYVSGVETGLSLVEIRRETLDSPVREGSRKSNMELIRSRDGLIFRYQGRKSFLKRSYGRESASSTLMNSAAPSYSKFETWLTQDGNLCPELIRQALVEFKHLFRNKLPPGLPPACVIDHTITLQPGCMPKKGVVYRIMGEELEAQRQILHELKTNKWISLTQSPFAAPSMIISKKDDASGNKQFRMVVNYQELNSMTISAEYPLPTIQEILDMLHGARVFTIMDMEQGLYQIRMAPQDQYKTAFRTCMGQFEFKVMPFGLRGAIGTLQAVMTHMFFPFIGKGVIAYLDDLLVYAPNVAAHASLLRKVLSILDDNKMYPKISKCRFGAPSTEYLGYTVSCTGITPSTEKIEAIKVWPDQLPNDTCVRQFLGTVNYCRMFMGPAFADMARPLKDLMRKGQKFVWEKRHTLAVRALKERLINYTTLQVPDPSKPYVLRTDASGYAVGAVLEQENKPLGFLNKRMNDTEMRYAIYDQELLALIRALEKWRRLLLRAHVTAFTEHQGLQYLLKLRGDKPVRGRVARWLDFLADFEHLQIVYSRGASNLIADALSRHPSIEPPPKTHVTTFYPQTSPPPTSLALHRSELTPLLEQLAVVPARTPYRRAELPAPPAPHQQRMRRDLCKQYIMYQAHDHPTAGHMGVHKTYDHLARMYYWPGMRAYVTTYVESCPRCKAAKHVSTKPQGLLQSPQIPNRRWSTVSLDFIVALPVTAQRHDSILTLVDTVSKMAHFIPTTSTVTAEGVVQLLADRLVRYHGLPKVLLSDRDPRFTAELWRLLCARFDIKRALSSSWHPQTDGQTERVHRTLEQALRTYIQTDESKWEDLLPAIELAYNCTTHSSTGLSPFEVMIGENPLRAADLDVVDVFEPTVTPPMTKLFQQLVDRAASHILQAQAQQKHYADRRRKDVEFEVGDKVWVSTRFMQPRGAAKFHPPFTGPFPITERIGKAAYRLELPPSMQVHPVFHVALLQRDKPRPPHMMQPQRWRPVEEPPDDSDPVYEVEHILDSRGSGPGEEFLVQWKGYPAEQATWEPLSNLTNCRALLRAFRASRTRRRRQEHRPP
ncbi:hypothetical protein Emed_006312 [Eimeria media]